MDPNLGSVRVICNDTYVTLEKMYDRGCEGDVYAKDYVDGTGNYCNNIFGINYKGWTPELTGEEEPKMEYEYNKPADGEVCFADFQAFWLGSECKEQDWETQSTVNEEFYYKYWTQGNCWTYENVQYNLDNNPKGTKSIQVNCDQGMGSLTYFTEDNCKGAEIKKDIAWFDEYGVLYKENSCLEAFGTGFTMRALGYPKWDEEMGGKEAPMKMMEE